MSSGWWVIGIVSASVWLLSNGCLADVDYLRGTKEGARLRLFAFFFGWCIPAWPCLAVVCLLYPFVRRKMLPYVGELFREADLLPAFVKAGNGPVALESGQLSLADNSAEGGLSIAQQRIHPSCYYTPSHVPGKTCAICAEYWRQDAARGRAPPLTPAPSGGRKVHSY